MNGKGGCASFFAGVLIVALLIAFSGLGAAQTGDSWEKPTWKTGDKILDMSGKYTMTQLLKSSSYSSTYGNLNMKGNFEYHAYMTVESTNAQKAGAQNYKIKIDMKFSLTGLSYGMTYSAKQYSYSIGMSANYTISVTGDLYLTVDKAALSELDIQASIKYDYTMVTGGNFGDYNGSGKGAMASTGDIQYGSEISASPPVDIFQFPVVVGEHWKTAESQLHLKNTMSGTSTYTEYNGTTSTISYSGPDYNYESNESLPAIPLWAPDNIPNPADIVLSGKTYKVYIIELDLSQIEYGVGIKNMIPKAALQESALPSIPVGKADLYYSTEANKFVGMGVKDGSGMTMFDTTKLPQEPPQPPTNSWLIVAVTAAVLMAVIVASTIMLLVKKGRKDGQDGRENPQDAQAARGSQGQPEIQHQQYLGQYQYPQNNPPQYPPQYPPAQRFP